MKRADVQRREHEGSIPAFTLIELLVVVAIIAILVSILLPALGNARRSAQAVVCATNLNHVGKAMATYLAENKSAYPFSYIYPYNGDGAYDPKNQPLGRDFGYVHWSYFLYQRGQVADNAFRCPTMDKGGAPRTNPGPDKANWEVWQVDNFGNTRDQANESSLADRQATRMPYTGNAAIFPRNKFTTELSGGQRKNRFVQENEVKSPSSTILVTEFSSNLKAITKAEAGGFKSISHRPVNPFYHLSSGTDEYGTLGPGFVYAPEGDYENYGLVSLEKFNEEGQTYLDGSVNTEMNAVGRHHPGGDRLGGSANFLYVDGHVVRKTVLQTLRAREWGERYYAVDGRNEVLDRYQEN